MSQVNTIRPTELPSIGIARIVGPIDIDHARKTRRMLLASLANQDNLLVDMSGVTVIDSAGVASLVEAHNTARRNGKAFALFHVNYPVMKVLKLARLDQAFTILSGAPGVRII
jgi:anti-sigma B factor antagonist